MENKKIDTEIVLCRRCHRRLKDAKSKALGYGETCYKKVQHKMKHRLFEWSDNNA